MNYHVEVPDDFQAILIVNYDSQIISRYTKAYYAHGYRIQYSTSSDFSSPKMVTIEGANTTSKTITGLTKGKTYYVRIRTYRKVSGTTYWSKWSAAKSVKITK